MMLGETKLEAQQWDPGWNCWRTGGAREAPMPLESPDCRLLVLESARYFRTLPSGARNPAVP
jgi:hypothetical protein